VCGMGREYFNRLRFVPHSDAKGPPRNNLSNLTWSFDLWPRCPLVTYPCGYAPRGRLARRQNPGVIFVNVISWRPLSAAGSVARESILRRMGMRPIHVHDPSPIIRCGKVFWIFSTGPGVISYHSTDMLQWKPGPRVLAKLPGWAHKAVPGNHNFLWAPDVITSHGHYLLYYAVSTFGAKRSVIGLASNKTLNPKSPAFDWRDRGLVIGSNRKDNFNAIDPGVIRIPGGKLWLGGPSWCRGRKSSDLAA